MWALRPALLLVVLLRAVAVPAGAGAVDSEAPARSPAHWLPGEAWVSNHWLPYDERRLYRLLHVKRSAVWLQLRDDRHNLAQLARRKGWEPHRLAAALVSPWQGQVGAGRVRLLRGRALRTLTQGHMAQHLFFHSLHQFAVPSHSRRIFGVPRAQFLQLRRTEFSPIQIGMLYGRSPGRVQAAVIKTLRERARAGVRSRSTFPAQARLLLSRQVSQVPRWLQQARYNGPPLTHHRGHNRGTLRHKPTNYASNPAISADGSEVAYEAYEQRLPVALQRGEINVFTSPLGAGPAEIVSAPILGKPRSAYNAAISADGHVIAYELSAGNLNFAKRYGRIGIEVHDTVTGGTLAVTAPAEQPGRSRSAFNPSLSADGRRLAFSAAGEGGLTVILVRDMQSGETALATPRPAGAPAGDAYGGQVSGDGRWLVFTWVPRDGERSQVYLRDLAERTATLVSRAAGAQGAPADNYSSHPSISPDGRWVAFSSAARNLGAPGAGVRIYLRDTRTGKTVTVSRAADGAAFEPAVSADGRRVAFTVARGGHSRVLLRDLGTGTTTVVASGGAAGVSFDPSISADGRRIVFSSTLSDLAGKHASGPRSVYVRDVAAGSTILVSDGSPVQPAGPHHRQ